VSSFHSASAEPTAEDNNVAPSARAQFRDTFGVSGRVYRSQLRWYRASAMSLAVAMTLISVLGLVLRISGDAAGLWLGIVTALLNLHFLAIRFLAGVGVGADGVLVREPLDTTEHPFAHIRNDHPGRLAGRAD
jgi:hypothetical protein